MSISVIELVIAMLGAVLAIILGMQIQRKYDATRRPRVDKRFEWLLFGASLIEDGYRYYPDWCSFMLREFDDSITPHLEHYFQTAQRVAEHPRQEWRAVIQRILAAAQPARDGQESAELESRS